MYMYVYMGRYMYMTSTGVALYANIQHARYMWLKCGFWTDQWVTFRSEDPRG